MRLPEMKYSDGLTKASQVRFGGYDHRVGAGDGTLWDMENMTGDQFPLLAARPPRSLERTLEEPGGLWAHGCLCWVENGGFYYDGKQVGTVAPGLKQFVGMGSRIIIWPDKAVYDSALDTFYNLEASVSTGGVSFQNGTLYGEEAERNTLTCTGADFRNLFQAGDAVTISGCTRHPENNKTPIIREVSEDGHSLRFYENVFELEGTETKPVGYTEPGTVTISRDVPDMDYICVNDNRLWGCKGDSIYCSKLGDPKNFNVFDGLGTDSFQVDSGSAGDFTACVSFLGYPCFFKADRIYKMYGDLPTNFQLMGSATLGVAPGSHRSLAVAGEALFYLSPAGVVSYTGGIPTPIGEVFGGQRFSDAVAGSDGLKYYISMRDSAGIWQLFVYDSQKGLWHREDRTEAIDWACLGGELYLLKADGGIWRVRGDVSELDTSGEGQISWWVEFNDFTEGSPDAKGYGKLQIRMELESGSTAWVDLKYDSLDEWKRVSPILTAERKRTFLLPVIPRRADHYRLRIGGTGGGIVHSIAREFYGGSERKTVRYK